MASSSAKEPAIQVPAGEQVKFAQRGNVQKAEATQVARSQPQPKEPAIQSR